MKTITRTKWINKDDSQKGYVGNVPFIVDMDKDTGGTVMIPVRIISDKKALRRPIYQSNGDK